MTIVVFCRIMYQSYIMLYKEHKYPTQLNVDLRVQRVMKTMLGCPHQPVTPPGEYVRLLRNIMLTRQINQSIFIY